VSLPSVPQSGETPREELARRLLPRQLERPPVRGAGLGDAPQAGRFGLRASVRSTEASNGWLARVGRIDQLIREVKFGARCALTFVAINS
jgi:hypothetical protein